MRWLILNTTTPGPFNGRHVVAIPTLLGIYDSEVLHLLLAGIEPGLDYSVSFTTTKPRRSISTTFYGTAKVGAWGTEIATDEEI